MAEWNTNVDYKVGDEVLVWGNIYICLADHKSKILATDITENKYWKRKE